MPAAVRRGADLDRLHASRLQTSAGNTLALQVDGDGNVNYGAIGEQVDMARRVRCD